MEADKTPSIEEAVFSILKNYVDPKRELKLSDRLIKDLKINSDVLSFEFALPLEEKLKIYPPVEEWKNVYTIRDVIELLKKYQGNHPNT